MLSFLVLMLLRVTHAAHQADNAIELRAFANYLQFNNNLRHAIMAVDETINLSTPNLIELEKLCQHTQLRVFNIGTPSAAMAWSHLNSTTMQAIVDFVKLQQIGAQRVAVFVPQMSSAMVHEKIFENAAVHGLFNNSYTWFIVANEVERTALRANVESLLGKYNFHVNADITLVRKSEHNSLHLYDLYKLCLRCTGGIKLRYKGNWSVQHGLQLLSIFRQSFVQQRKNLQRTQVRVGTALINKPVNVTNMQHLLNWETDFEFDLMQRKSFRLLKDIETMYNMSFNVAFASTFGGWVADEQQWTGIFAQVANQQVDICAVPLRMTFERLATFKYTPAFHVEDINTLLRHPRRNNIRNIFFAPLTATVWWCTLALIALTILLLAMHMRHEYQYQQHGSLAQQSVNNSSGTLPLLESRFDFFVLVVMEAILMQGPEPNIFNLLSTRILIVTICIFSILLMQFYGAFIVGSLLAEEPRSITTSQALYESNFEIGMENVSYNFDIIKKSLDPYALRIFNERICRKRNLYTLDQGVERIRRGHFAFQTGVQPMYRSLMRILTESEYCDLQEIFINHPFVIGTILTKNASYYEFLAQGILKYRSSGLLQYNDILWRVRQPDCSLVHQNVVEVDLEHFIPALALLALSMGFAFFVLLLEIIYHRCLLCRQRLLMQRAKEQGDLMELHNIEI